MKEDCNICKKQIADLDNAISIFGDNDERIWYCNENCFKKSVYYNNTEERCKNCGGKMEVDEEDKNMICSSIFCPTNNTNNA